MLRGLAGYRPLRRLSRGGQAEVFLAVDEQLRRKVVIKLYRLEKDPKRRREALTEAQRIALITSSRIPHVHDVIASGEYLAVVMQYLPGCDLAALLAREQPLPPSMALAIAIDIVAALAALHRHHLVHGDLSERNVLLDGRGRAMVIDFGIAVGSGRRPRGISRLAATPEHLSSALLSPQSDFFALGLLLYRMLFAAHPFVAGQDIDAERLCRGLHVVPSVPGLSGEAMDRLAVLLRSLLAGDAAARPGNSRSLRSELREQRARLTTRPSDHPSLAPLARDETPRPDVPPLPTRLVSLPLRQRGAALFLDLWQTAADGARAVIVAAVLIVLAIPVLLLSMEGPCLELRALRMDVSPSIRGYLPDASTLETQILKRLRRHYPRGQMLGPIGGSDSYRILRQEGLRDVCVAERVLELGVSCGGTDCVFTLTSYYAPEQYRSEQTIAVNAGLNVILRAVDQLVDDHLADVSQWISR